MLLNYHRISLVNFDLSEPGGDSNNPPLANPTVLEFVANEVCSGCYEYTVDILVKLADSVIDDLTVDPHNSYNALGKYLSNGLVEFTYSTPIDLSVQDISSISINNPDKNPVPSKTVFGYSCGYSELRRVSSDDYIDRRRLIVRLTLKPLISRGEQHKNTRIFRNQSPREIIALVLSKINMQVNASSNRATTYIVDPKDPTATTDSNGNIALAMIRYIDTISAPNENTFGVDNVFNQKISFYMQYKETDLNLILRLLDMSGCFFYISFERLNGNAIEVLNIASYDFNASELGVVKPISISAKLLSSSNIPDILGTSLLSNVSFREYLSTKIGRLEVIDYPVHGIEE